jgi:hypothetical protein
MKTEIAIRMGSPFYRVDDKLAAPPTSIGIRKTISTDRFSQDPIDDPNLSNRPTSVDAATVFHARSAKPEKMLLAISLIICGAQANSGEACFQSPLVPLRRPLGFGQHPSDDREFGGPQ